MSELQELIDIKTEKIEEERKERLSELKVDIVRQPLLDWYIWYYHSSHDNDDLDRRWYYIHPSVRSTMNTFVEEESIKGMGKVQGALITCGLGLIDDGLQFNACSNEYPTVDEDGMYQDELEALGDAKELISRRTKTDQKYHNKLTHLRPHDSPEAGKRIAARVPDGTDSRINRICRRLGLERRCLVVHMTAIACLYSSYIGNEEDREELEKYKEKLDQHVTDRVEHVQTMVQNATRDV